MDNKMRKMGQRSISQAQIDADWRAFWQQNERELQQERAAKVALVRRLGAKKAAELIAIHERWVIGNGRAPR